MAKNKEEVTKALLSKLRTRYKDAHCALHHETPFQLLIATILSAQCTDERVNKVTPHLFKEFPGPEQLSKASIERVEAIIRSTGFFKNKAKNIVACSEAIMATYAGRVPQEMAQLTALAGVGRKTANVVLGNAFGIPSGIVVDTHVLRLSNRMGWVRTQSPEIAEKKLQQIIPQKDWIQFPHWMIFHGRQICTARSPKCAQCFLQDLCPKKGV